MNFKLIGGIFVVVSCGGFGFFLSLTQKREEWLLRQLVSALDYMLCELQYRLTPLPELCRQAGQQGKGVLGQIFLQLAETLEYPMSSNVGSCMEKVLSAYDDIPVKVLENLQLLGSTLGRFDLEGQAKELELLRQQCRADIVLLSADKIQRQRSYQTLGLCAGAALVILFI